MSLAYENAIADFLEAGGRVSRVKASVRVTEGELLDYLANCGIVAKYTPGDYRAYLCEGKRVSLSRLVALANEHRRSLHLPPFAPRVRSITPAGPRADNPPMFGPISSYRLSA